MQRVFHRTINRANIPIAYSQGFNPHPKTSFASALPVGQTGISEWMDIQLDENAQMTPDELAERLNAAAPMGLRVVEAKTAPEGYPSLTAAMQSAEYTAFPLTELDLNANEMQGKIAEFLSAPIMVEKKKKSKGKSVIAETDIRPTILSMEYNAPTIRLTGRLDASGGMNAELVLQAFSKFAALTTAWQVRRDKIVLLSK